MVALLFAQSYPEKVHSLSFSGIFPVEPDNWEEMMKEEEESYEQLFQNEEAVSVLNEMHGDND